MPGLGTIGRCKFQRGGHGVNSARRFVGGQPTLTGLWITVRSARQPDEASGCGSSRPVWRRTAAVRARYAMRVLVFCPVSHEELATLASGGAIHDVEAYAATSNFLQTFGLTERDAEDAERTAAYLAGLAGLLRTGSRVVVVAETSTKGASTSLGEVIVPTLTFEAVSALFADDAGSADAVAKARASLDGLTVSEAWDDLAHEALLARVDLLWYGPDEWESLISH